MKEPAAPARSTHIRLLGRRAFGPDGPCWSYGQRLGRARSFFCHHISGAHRLPNGNTLITQVPICKPLRMYISASASVMYASASAGVLSPSAPLVNVHRSFVILANSRLAMQGPQGIIFEVTAAGEEVWRYISPMQNSPMTVSATRQGDSRTGGRFSIFFARK